MKNGVILESKAGKEGRIILETEDGGCAKIGEPELGYASITVVTNGVARKEKVDTEDDGFFVRLQSWAEDSDSPNAHKTIKKLEGKRIKVTIEILED